MNSKAYQDLINGIVEQACCDFINSNLKIYGIKRDKKEDGTIIYKPRTCKLSEKDKIAANRMIIDCVGFFKSRWFKRLRPGIDGEKLINTLWEHVDTIILEFEKQEEERIKTLKKRGRKKGQKSEKPYEYKKKTGRPRKVAL